MAAGNFDIQGKALIILVTCLVEYQCIITGDKLIIYNGGLSLLSLILLYSHNTHAKNILLHHLNFFCLIKEIRTYVRTMQLLDQISPVGRFGENKHMDSKQCRIFFLK